MQPGGGEEKKSSGRVLLIHFLEVVLMFKSSVVLSLVESVVEINAFQRRKEADQSVSLSFAPSKQ
jgi:hypothetical protein